MDKEWIDNYVVFSNNFYGCSYAIDIICALKFARDVLNKKDANSREFDIDSSYKVIDYLDGQSDDIKKGGTLRLGAYPCKIDKDSKLYEVYQEELISERHRHRYEFNNLCRKDFIEHGMKLSGKAPDDSLIEAVEITDHKFYLGVQYHPEFKSRPNKAHPLFKAFIKASIGE